MPSSTYEQSKCIKLTIDTNIQLTLAVQNFTFLRSTKENCKNIVGRPGLIQFLLEGWSSYNSYWKVGAYAILVGEWRTGYSGPR
jgi:hypothetical protein